MSRLPFHRLMKIVIPALIVFLAVLSIPVYRQVTGEALPFSLQARTPSLTPLRSLFELNDLGTVQPEQTQVLSLTPSQDGRIYIGTAYLGQLSFYSGSFTSAGQATPGGTRIYSLATGKDGNIYGGMDNNAYFFAYYPSDGSFNPLGQAVSEEQEVKAVVSGLDGLIYGGTAPNGHFFVYDPSQGGRPVDLGQPLAGEASISALSVDSNGLIWGGSSPSGFVFFFNPNSRSFSQVGQTSSAVTAIAAKAGSIFIGTSTGRLFSFSQANGLSDLGQATADNGRIETLTGGSDGRIYGGTYPDGRVFAYDPVSSAFIDLGSPVKGESSVGALAFGTDGKLYAGTGPTGHLAIVSTTPPPPADITPPLSQLTLEGKAGSGDWFLSPVTATITATDSESGVANIAYDLGGGWITYTSPFPFSAEGSTTLTYHAVDLAGNVEADNQRVVNIDTVSPTVSITAPQAKDYLHSDGLTLVYTATDSTSGLSALVAKLDGVTVTNGLTVDLFTYAVPSPHLFEVIGSDGAGNQTRQAVRFRVVATIGSLILDVNRYRRQGDITSDALSESLVKKLTSAQMALDRGNKIQAVKSLLAFASQVASQRGKGISQAAATMLVSESRYVIVTIAVSPYSKK